MSKEKVQPPKTEDPKDWEKFLSQTGLPAQLPDQWEQGEAPPDFEEVAKQMAGSCSSHMELANAMRAQFPGMDSRSIEVRIKELDIQVGI